MRFVSLTSRRNWRDYDTMKAMALMLGLTGGALVAALAQTNEVKTTTTDAGARFHSSRRLERMNRSTVTYSGIANQAVKADNRFQLINPFAPAHYGDGRANVVRNPVTGRAEGVAFWTVSFR